MSKAELVFGIIETPWGPMAAARTPRGLCRTTLPGDAEVRAARFAGMRRDDAAFADLSAQLERYFAGGPMRFDLPLDLTPLTAFTRQVLTELHRVRFGETVSYGELAVRVGRPNAARAIGGAMGRNPLPLIIPCHRVLAGGGGIGGFSAPGGLDIKRRLLEWEGAVVPA